MTPHNMQLTGQLCASRSTTRSLLSLRLSSTLSRSEASSLLIMLLWFPWWRMLVKVVSFSLLPLLLVLSDSTNTSLLSPDDDEEDEEDDADDGGDDEEEVQEEAEDARVIKFARSCGETNAGITSARSCADVADRNRISVAAEGTAGFQNNTGIVDVGMKFASRFAYSVCCARSFSSICCWRCSFASLAFCSAASRRAASSSRHLAMIRSRMDDDLLASAASVADSFTAFVN